MAGSPLPAISHFSEDQSSELRDRIFDEFNTLAVILRAHSATFIREVPSTLEEEEPDASLVSTFHCSVGNNLAQGIGNRPLIHVLWLYKPSHTSTRS